MLVSIKITNLNAVVHDHQLQISVAAIIMGGGYTVHMIEYDIVNNIRNIIIDRDKVNEATVILMIIIIMIFDKLI